MKKLNYWIWLSRGLSKGANVNAILKAYEGNVQAVFADGPKGRYQKGVFSERALAQLEAHAPEESYGVLERCAKDGIDVLTPDMEEYPPLLREIPCFPAVLYAKGNPDVLKGRLPFAMVGTRHPAQSTVARAAETAAVLSECGFLVVSGGAVGVDNAAHTGALHAGHPTVAVLGGGIGYESPRAQAPLRAVIAERGLLLSEHEPGTPAYTGAFPQRNRIIAGMTKGTLVAEARIKSGSLITAARATDYDRDLFVLQAEARSAAFEGAYQLLDDGAVCVNTVSDIYNMYMCSEYGACLHLPKEEARLYRPLEAVIGQKRPVILSEEDRYRAKKAEEQREAAISFAKKKIPGEDLSKTARTVYDCFTGHPLSIDTLSKQAATDLPELLSALTELELLGYLTKEGAVYKLKG